MNCDYGLGTIGTAGRVSARDFSERLDEHML